MYSRCSERRNDVCPSAQQALPFPQKKTRRVAPHRWHPATAWYPATAWHPARHVGRLTCDRIKPGAISHSMRMMDWSRSYSSSSSTSTDTVTSNCTHARLRTRTAHWGLSGFSVGSAPTCLSSLSCGSTTFASLIGRARHEYARCNVVCHVASRCTVLQHSNFVGRAAAERKCCSRRTADRTACECECVWRRLCTQTHACTRAGTHACESCRRPVPEGRRKGAAAWPPQSGRAVAAWGTAARGYSQPPARARAAPSASEWNGPTTSQHRNNMLQHRNNTATTC